MRFSESQIQSLVAKGDEIAIHRIANGQFATRGRQFEADRPQVLVIFAIEDRKLCDAMNRKFNH